MERNKKDLAEMILYAWVLLKKNKTLTVSKATLNLYSSITMKMKSKMNRKAAIMRLKILLLKIYHLKGKCPIKHLDLVIMELNNNRVMLSILPIW